MRFRLHNKSFSITVSVITSEYLLRAFVRRFFRQPIDDVLAALEHLVTVRNPLTTMVPALVTMLVTWFLYVGVHELLHAAGCELAGGDVTKLEISSRYGGRIYAKYFDFVVAESQYAGRLSGFTSEPDSIYLSTVFGPFVLTVLFGVALVKLCAKRRRPILFGVAIIVGLAPFYNLQGDYFEMGSILVTRTVTILFGGGGYPPMFVQLRSDDIFKLLDTLVRSPGELGLTTAGLVAAGVGVIMLSFVVDVLLAFATYWLGHLVSRLFIPAHSAAGRSASAM